MAEGNTIPNKITTDEIGKRIHSDYYDKKDQSAAIDYFMVMFGKPILDLPEVTEIEFSQKITGVDIKRPIDDGWAASKLLFFKFSKQITQREQEKLVNSKIRETIKQLFKDKIEKSFLPTLPDVGIIFTRACLYKEKPKIVPQANQIGSILRSKYQPGDTSIDYFFLVVQSEDKDPNLHTIAFTELKKIPNAKWKEMAEQEWPGVFFGYYPKTEFMTEREREWDLKEKIRESLKKNIKKAFIDAGKKDPRVHVIIMRACLYTAKEEHVKPTEESAQPSFNDS